MPQYTNARQAASVTILTADHNVLVLESPVPDRQAGKTLVRTPCGFFQYDKEEKSQPKDGAVEICDRELIQLVGKDGTAIEPTWDGKNPSPDDIEARRLLSITPDRLEGITILEPLDYSLQLAGGPREPILTIPYKFQATVEETAAIDGLVTAMSNQAYREKVKELTEGHSAGAITGVQLLDLEEFSGPAVPENAELLAPSADLQAWQECTQGEQALGRITPVSGFPSPPSTPCTDERIAAGEFTGVGSVGLILMDTGADPEVVLCRRAGKGESYDSGGGYVNLHEQEQPLGGLIREINEELVGFFDPDNNLITAADAIEGASAGPVLYDLQPEQFYPVPVERPVDYRPMNQGNPPSCNFVYRVVLTPPQAERVRAWVAAMQDPDYGHAVHGITREVDSAMIRPLSYLVTDMKRDTGKPQWIANPVLAQACETLTSPLSAGATTEVRPLTEHPGAAREIDNEPGAVSRILEGKNDQPGPHTGER